MANFYTPAHGHAPNGTFFTYTANALNQLDSTQKTLNTDPQDAVAITYDANGNMTYDGNNQTFEWDAANRLVAINYLDTGDRTEFAYDGLNRRVKIVEYGPGVTATIQPSGSSYTTFTTAPFTLPTGSYTLTFAGLNPNGGNNMALVDSVALNSTLVANGSFESPSVTDYQANPSDTAWSYTSDSGIAHDGGTYTSSNPSAPAGSQVAFVKDTGLLSQIWSASAGTYALSFKAAQRGSNNTSHQQLRVNLRPSGSVISTKNFVWCGNQICEERDASNSVTKRFFAEGEKRIGGSDAGNYYYSRDHLGSIREVTDSTGALKAQYDYDAYGNEVVVSGNMNVDFGFTGHYFHQPSGLNLAMYRAYNPALGRWISRDPLEEQSGVNLYAYSGDEPIGLIDPLGLDTIEVKKWNGQFDFPLSFPLHVLLHDIPKAFGISRDQPGAVTITFHDICPADHPILGEIHAIPSFLGGAIKLSNNSAEIIVHSTLVLLALNAGDLNALSFAGLSAKCSTAECPSQPTN